MRVHGFAPAFQRCCVKYSPDEIQSRSRNDSILEELVNVWKHFTQRFGIELPIIQAPMAGSSDAELAIAVSEAGGLGSLPCAMLTPDQVVSAVNEIRLRTSRPINLNFFCHRV